MLDKGMSDAAYNVLVYPRRLGHTDEAFEELKTLGYMTGNKHAGWDFTEKGIKYGSAIYDRGIS